MISEPRAIDWDDQGRTGYANEPRQSRARRSRKLSFNEQREFDSLPARIEALEEEEHRLRAESESGEFYKAGADHIRAVLARLEQNVAEHEAALARWLELEERSGR